MKEDGSENQKLLCSQELQGGSGTEPDALYGKRIDLQSGSLRIRSLMQEDLPCLLQWLTDKRVLAYYDGRDTQYDLETLRTKYGGPITSVFYRVIMEHNGVPAGYGQIFLLDDVLRKEYTYPQTEETVFAMDQFIGLPALWNQGIGTAYIRAVLSYLQNEEHADVVLLDPHQDNLRAIRAYEKAGFQKIHALPAHEFFEGKWKDCLLMEYRCAGAS